MEARTSARLISGVGRPFPVGWDQAALWTLILAIALLTAPPLLILIESAFGLGRAAGPTLGNLRDVLALGTWRLWRTTLLFAAGSSVLSVALGVSTAWLLARTDAPFRSLVLAGSFLSLSMPLIVKTIGWILLLGPNGGLITSALAGGSAGGPPFRLFSLGGMILVEGLLWTPVALLLALPSLAAIDPTLEEAAAMCGARRIQILVRVTTPLALPGALAILLLSLVRSLEAFEVPLLIGAPGRQRTVTTAIYDAVQTGFLPNYGEASAYSLLLILIVAGPLALYWRATRDSAKFAAVSGKGFRPTRLELGWAKPAATLWMLIVPVSLAAPLLALFYASLQREYVSPTLAAPIHITLSNYAALLSREEVRSGILNSGAIGAVAASVVAFLALVISWILARRRESARFLLDGFASLPLAFPGLVLGIAVLQEFLRLRWIPIYGTAGIVVVAFVIKFLPIGVRFCSSSVMTIHRDLEDSAYASGASFAKVLRRIVAPLAAPAVAGAWIYVFMYALRDLSTALLLSGAGNSIVAVVILDLWNNGELPVLAALSVILAAAAGTLGFALMRLGLSRSFHF